MSGGFLNDFAGAAGCDGGGNAMARGMNKMFSEVGMDPMMAEGMAVGHADPMIDEMAAEGFPQDPAWQEEFFSHAAPSHMPPGMMHPMGVNEYMAREASQPHVHPHFNPMMQQQQQQQQPMQHAAAAQADAQQQQQLAAVQTAAAAVDWAAAFQNQSTLFQQHPERYHATFPVQQEAQADVQEAEPECQTFGIEGEENVTFDDKQAKSEFFEFMDKVKRGDIVLEEEDDDAQQHGARVEGPEMQEDAGARLGYASDLVAEGAMPQGVAEPMADGPLAQDWAEELMAAQAQEAAMEAPVEDPMAEDWTKQYQEELAKLGQRQKVPYEFQENNPYLYHDNPFQEGLELLAAGTLSEAVLAFEAACQKDEEHVDAWKYLGTTQAENEKDQPAIAALEQCRTLAPDNNEVLMALSVSLTNENHFSEAVDALQTWLLAHPRFREHADRLQAVPEGGQADDYTSAYFFVDPGQHSRVVRMFELAAELAGGAGCDEVYIALGVLFNMSHEYGRAVTAFEKALELRHDDPKLWNKLGASLANGNRCSEALRAYDKALDLNPGYVRTLYNIGICYSNLGEHKEAVTHHLRAIHMQNGGRDGTPSGTREMWDGLCMAFSLMNRPDLVEKAAGRDVALFKDEFNIDVW